MINAIAGNQWQNLDEKSGLSYLFRNKYDEKAFCIFYKGDKSFNGAMKIIY